MSDIGLPEAEVQQAFQQRSELEVEVNNLRARIRELEAEREDWLDPETNTVWSRPTAWAYAAACKALEKHRQRAEKAEAERDAIEAKTIERCAQIVEGYPSFNSSRIAAIIRALKPSDEERNG